MNSPPGGPPQGVPTLTEVIDWRDSTAPPSVPAADETAFTGPASMAVQPEPVLARLPTDAELTEQVLAQVQRQLDLMIEYRMREALTPLLARATDSLVRDARNELASTLRDVVARAVAQELTRHRNR
jgi:Arc/MetJ family transcription regulator